MMFKKECNSILTALPEEHAGKSDVNIYLAIGGEAGSVREMIFKYKRIEKR